MNAIDHLSSILSAAGMKQQTPQDILTRIKRQAIETPSWGYANSGTRFQVFRWPGAARNTREKLQDAAKVHSLTGIAPSVALHIPWDAPENGDYKEVSQLAKSLGLTIGAINPNVFQDQDYRLGSLGNPKPNVRARALAHIVECCDIMKKTGSQTLSLWFADGTNYPGQDSLRERKQRFESALVDVYAALPSQARMLLEYKFFEPAFYSTDLPDWGFVLNLCKKLGDRAQVLVDLGHHASGSNIEQIVAFLLDEGRLGGFHFNNRKYADDDLIVGSINPFELFLIYHELTTAELETSGVASATARQVAYMIDQSHNIEGKMLPMLHSVINCQEAYAKALLVDRKRLAEAQQAGDVLEAHRILTDAFKVDVRPLLACVREEMGCPPNPIAAYLASGYEERIRRERA